MLPEKGTKILNQEEEKKLLLRSNINIVKNYVLLNRIYIIINVLYVNSGLKAEYVMNGLSR